MRRGPNAPAEEVEELLKAAQDDLLLRLSVNRTPNSSSSFFANPSSSSSSLHPDLARRLDALKLSPPPPIGSSGRSSGAAETTDVREGKGKRDGGDEILRDELAARFTALKGSFSSGLPEDPVVRVSASDGEDDSAESEDEEGREVSKKEVEKVMQWAMDAVRLDLISNAKGSGEDSSGAEEEEEEDDEESDPEEPVKEKDDAKKKKTDSKKPPPKKWFIF